MAATPTNPPRRAVCGIVRSRSTYPVDRFFLAFRAATAALEAFFARDTRSSGVIVSRDRFPPILPPFAPCLRKKSMASGGSFRVMSES